MALYTLPDLPSGPHSTVAVDIFGNYSFIPDIAGLSLTFISGLLWSYLSKKKENYLFFFFVYSIFILSFYYLFNIFVYSDLIIAILSVVVISISSLHEDTKEFLVFVCFVLFALYGYMTYCDAKIFLKKEEVQDITLAVSRLNILPWLRDISVLIERSAWNFTIAVFILFSPFIALFFLCRTKFR